MSGSADLRSLLKSWPYDPEDDARVVRGDDGRAILQVRTPLGIEQYEMEGRPDGLRPYGKETALEHYLERLRQAREEGREASFQLRQRECAELFNEGTLIYYRYVRLFQLKDWPRTIRDTSRNLRLFDFVHSHAAREEDRQFLEKWRPYIVRVSCSAHAMQALEQNAYGKAYDITMDAIKQIEGLGELDDETFRFERERSLVGLSELAGQIQKNRPLTELEKLEHRLRRAIERQEFEQAAKLRDQIRELRKGQPC
jgi:hypothetical protein